MLWQIIAISIGPLQNPSTLNNLQKVTSECLVKGAKDKHSTMMGEKVLKSKNRPHVTLIENHIYRKSYTHQLQPATSSSQMDPGQNNSIRRYTAQPEAVLKYLLSTTLQRKMTAGKDMMRLHLLATKPQAQISVETQVGIACH